MLKRNLVYIFLALSVLLPLTTVVKIQTQKAKSDVVLVEIEPYDPRDLLYGHYLVFKTKWNWKTIEETASACTDHKNCCLCLEEGTKNPLVSVMNCKAAQENLSCKHSLQGQSYGANSFETGLSRFYVDERFAMPLEQVFREGKEKFSVGLYVQKGRAPLLETLYIGDKNLKDYIAENGGKVPLPKKQENTPVMPAPVRQP